MATLYVGTSDGDFLTIQEAVSAAAAGDTIVVQGGEYAGTDERVTINKSLTLKADGDVTMRGLNIGGTDFDLVVDGINFVAAEADASGVTGYAGNASCISQTGNLRNVTIENCTFDLTKAGMTRTYGIFLSLGTWGFENLVVRNNECNGYYNDEAYSGYGLIYAANVQDADISNNVITYAAAHAIQLSLTGTTYMGSGEQTVQISGNVIEKSYASAVYCADLHNSDMTVAINDNIVKDVQEGSCGMYQGAIRIGASTISGVEITGNLIEGAQVGIYNAAAIKEGSNGEINISGNSISVSQIHAVEEGVTPKFSGFGGTEIPEGTADENIVVEGTEIPASSDMSVVYVNKIWSSQNDGDTVVAGGKVLAVGTNAFTSLNAALSAKTEATEAIVVGSDISESLSGKTFSGNILAKEGSAVTIADSDNSNYVNFTGATIGSGITFEAKYAYLSQENTLNGDFVSSTTFYNSGTTTINGTLQGYTFMSRYYADEAAGVYVVGSAAAGKGAEADVQLKVTNYLGHYSGTFSLKDTAAEMGYILLNGDTDGEGYSQAKLVLDNAKLSTIGGPNTQPGQVLMNGDAAIIATNGSVLNFVGPKDFAYLSMGANNSISLTDSTMNLGKEGQGGNSLNGTISLKNSAINSLGKIDSAAAISLSGASSIVATKFTNNGTVSIDETSKMTVSTIFTNNGTITVDVTDTWEGVATIIDAAAGTASLGNIVLDEADVANGLKSKYDTETGDLKIYKVGTSKFYVNSSWNAAFGEEVAEGKYFGINAFATTKAAYMAARDLGGEITIDLTGAGAEKIDDGTIGLGNAGKNGIYTITGGTVNTTSYGLSFANTETTVKFKDATFKLAKLYVANAGGSLIVDNSVIGSAYYSGNGGGWVTAGKGSISINNSVFGANFSNYTAEELAAMPRSASDVKAAVEAGTYKYWAFGANNSGPHMGTAGEISVEDSTLSTSWISLIDRAEMVLDNSVLYYGAAISIGAGQVDNSYGPYNSNEIGWDAQIWWNPVLSSAAGYREGEVATLTVKDSIVRNIGNGNGNSGAHIQVGGSFVNGIDKTVTGECAGVLNIINSEFYTTPFDADGNAIERKYDLLVVKSNGTVNVEDSTVVTAKLVNDGAFNVTGKSTLKIGTVSGSAIVAAVGAEFVDSTVGGTISAQGDVTFTGDNTVKTLSAVNGGTITVEEGKTLALNNFSFGSKATNTAEYVIEGGKITAGYGFFQHGTYTLNADFETGYMYYSYGSNITVNGNFHSQGKGDGLDYVRGSLTIAADASSTHDKSLWIGQPASWGEMQASLTVEGTVSAKTLAIYEGSSVTVLDGGKILVESLENTGTLNFVFDDAPAANTLLIDANAAS
ncbi:MAG: hypothetical protein J6S54_02150, partial [Lentisphaeria bacterium]|nr:hypothetical protein [Lentisphaeria bacterium]